MGGGQKKLDIVMVEVCRVFQLTMVSFACTRSTLMVKLLDPARVVLESTRFQPQHTIFQCISRKAACAFQNFMIIQPLRAVKPDLSDVPTSDHKH